LKFAQTRSTTRAIVHQYGQMVQEERASFYGSPADVIRMAAAELNHDVHAEGRALGWRRGARGDRLRGARWSAAWVALNNERRQLLHQSPIKK
jgi:hypothetical protein